MSRSLTDLHPEMAERVRRCIYDWLAAGLDVLITTTYRSDSEQAALYAQGRTAKGRIVTNAKPGQSSHNYTVNGRPASLAIDVVPLRHGKCVWGTRGDGIDGDPTDDDTDDLELWQRVAAIAKKNGLKWYGDPGSKFKEMAHFELPNAAELMRK